MTTTPGTPKRLVVAINPTASFGKGRTVGPEVVARLHSLGHDVTALQEPTFADLQRAARKALDHGPDALVMVGGDGMVNLGANLVAQRGIPLGIVPSGTGNDMARALGIPRGDVAAAVAVIDEALGRDARVIDAARVSFEGGERWFACMLSAGFDAIVNERANRMTRPKGASRYTIALLIELVRLRPIRYRLVLDGDELATPGVLVSVGNGVSLGGGMRVTPDALLDDGLLDVLVVQPLSRANFLRIFPRVFAGTHVTDPRVRIDRARLVRLEAPGVVAYADGERLAPLPIDIECVPGALRVLAPVV